MFIVRSPLKVNGLANAKIQDCGNRLKPSDTLAQPTPESTAERLAQKPTSGSASSPTGSPKSTDTAAPSAGVSVVNEKQTRLFEARSAHRRAIEERETAEANEDQAQKALHKAAETFRAAQTCAGHARHNLGLARQAFNAASDAYAAA
jgi:hypothetical protein